jgi:hypothetical protein
MQRQKMNVDDNGVMARIATHVMVSVRWHSCREAQQVDPAYRLSAKEAMDHPFLRGVKVDHSSLVAATGNVLDMMRAFNAERRFRRAALIVMSAAVILHMFYPTGLQRVRIGREAPGSPVVRRGAEASGFGGRGRGGGAGPTGGGMPRSSSFSSIPSVSVGGMGSTGGAAPGVGATTGQAGQAATAPGSTHTVRRVVPVAPAGPVAYGQRHGRSGSTSSAPHVLNVPASAAGGEMRLLSSTLPASYGASGGGGNSTGSASASGGGVVRRQLVPAIPIHHHGSNGGVGAGGTGRVLPKTPLSPRGANGMSCVCV